MRACLRRVLCELNARPRAGLGGVCPADRFHRGPRLHVTQPERAATFDWLWQHTQRTLSTMETVNQRRINAAWRHTAESWLRSRGLMAINYSHPNTENKNQLLPLFFDKWSH